MIKVRAQDGLRIFHFGVDDKIPAGLPWVSQPRTFANPWSHEKGKSLHKTKTAREAVEKYRTYLLGNRGLIKDAKKLLRGKDLECGCNATKEEDCYAVVLMEFANAPDTEEKKSQEVKVIRKSDPGDRRNFYVDEPVLPKPKREKKVKYVPTFKEF